MSSAILSAAEASRDKLRPTESWIPSLTRFLIFGAVIAELGMVGKYMIVSISDLVAILIHSGGVEEA